MLIADPVIFCILLFVMMRNYHNEYFFSSLLGGFFGANIGLYVAGYIGFFLDLDVNPLIFLILVFICMKIGAEQLAALFVVEVHKYKINKQQQAVQQKQRFSNTAPNHNHNDWQDVPHYNDTEFEYRQKEQPQAKSNHHQQTDNYSFDPSRFKDKKAADRYAKWKNMVNDPNASPSERHFAMRRMVAADSGEDNDIKALPAPRGY